MSDTNVWKNSKGSTPISEMATPHLENAIEKVKSELSDTSASDYSTKQELLENLQTEFSTRSSS